jgi:hypothetical protein
LESLNLLEPSGPVEVYNGIAFVFVFVFVSVFVFVFVFRVGPAVTHRIYCSLPRLIVLTTL